LSTPESLVVDDVALTDTPLKESVPVARILGAPVHDLPEDLYIPPDALEVILETFEGPLDLLLYLIRRQGFSIVDIPVADITRQYISYIEMMSELKLELAAEYLLMAAILAEIKSKLLLPRPEAVEGDEHDPRAELIRRLQEYEQFKAAALEIDQLTRLERDVHEIETDISAIRINKIYPEVDIHEVLLAFKDVLRRADQVTHHQIRSEPLSVRERMSRILGSLQKGMRLPFHALFDLEEGKAGVVVSLLAILEMSKERIIEIIQEEPLGPLEICVLTSTGTE
jgi:segregation and condensation protein A